MNYIKEAENILWHYNDLYKSLTNLNKQISKIVSHAKPSELNAIALDQTGIRGSRKDDDTYNILFEIQVLTENKEQTELELSKIDELLNDISVDPDCELYGTILRKWYIERIPKEDIANDLKYSVRSIYDLKNKAIRKFAVQKFGIPVLNCI